MTTMFATLLLLLASQPVTAGGPPVRIWLGSGPAVAFGAKERVYVHTSTDGNLVVLHARADGQVEVLFPATPTSNPFVRAGTYEIPGLSGGAAFAAAETAGRGTVVAALSPDPMWFDEFVHNGAWNVAATGGATNAEALLTDVVQRMLGDGIFNYDVVTYDVVATALTIVAAPVTSFEPLVVCVGCSFIQAARTFPHYRRRPPAYPPTRQPAVQTVVLPVSPVVTAGLAPFTVAVPVPDQTVVAEPQRPFRPERPTERRPERSSDRPPSGAVTPAPAAIGWRHPQPVIR